VLTTKELREQKVGGGKKEGRREHNHRKKAQALQRENNETKQNNNNNSIHILPHRDAGNAKQKKNSNIMKQRREEDLKESRFLMNLRGV
jgi:hypothetical protein